MSVCAPVTCFSQGDVMFLQQISRKYASLSFSVSLALIMLCIEAFSICAVPRCSVSGFTEARLYGLPYFPYSVTTGDFNGDNRPDIAIGNSIGPNGGASVMLN